MSHFKVIATDLDGTLLTSAHELTPRTIRTIQAAMAQGVTVILATGKTPTAREMPVQALGLATPGVYSQGLVLVNPDGSIRSQQAMNQIAMRTVIAFAEEFGYPVAAYHGYEILAEALTSMTDFMMAHHEPHPRMVESLAAAVDGAVINKLVMEIPAEDMPTQRALLASRLDGQAVLVPSMPHMLEVLPPGASKGVGVAQIVTELGFTMDDVLALGDGENDIEMLQMAAVGVAMGNAMPAVKAVADYHTASNDEDGVAQAVEHFILQKAAGWPDEPPR